MSYAEHPRPCSSSRYRYQRGPSGEGVLSDGDGFRVIAKCVGSIIYCAGPINASAVYAFQALAPAGMVRRTLPWPATLTFVTFPSELLSMAAPPVPLVGLEGDEEVEF